MVKIGTTGSSLRVQLVTLPDQHLTWQSMSWGHATAVAIDGVDSSFHELCAIAFKTNPVKTLVWLLLAVTYSDSLTMSQAEVPLEWIHVFY